MVYVPGSKSLQYSPLFVVLTVWFMPKMCITAPGIGLLFSSWTNPVKHVRTIIFHVLLPI